MIDELPPLGLYVHTPWCVKKCPYCDFNSHALRAEIPEQAYVAALLDDLMQELSGVQDRVVETIYIGGGTPSLFSGSAIAQLLTGIKQRLSVAKDAEITMEINPESAQRDRFYAYQEAGVNRLSIGAQSMHPDSLQKLGRAHGVADTIAAMSAARTVGFSNINLDLMHGLPDQTVAGALEDVSAIVDLQPEQISWYQLTLEPNTAFYQQPPSLPEDDAIAHMYHDGRARLLDAGYQFYEISAYPKPGYHARHNENYWMFGDYLGIGAGAHGKITDLATQSIKRRVKRRHPNDYLRGGHDALLQEQAVAMSQLPFEFMLNALRLVEGVPASLFTERTGLPLSAIAEPLGHARSQGLLVDDSERIAATPMGLQYLNNVLLLFMT